MTLLNVKQKVREYRRKANAFVFLVYKLEFHHSLRQIVDFGCSPICGLVLLSVEVSEQFFKFAGYSPS